MATFSPSAATRPQHMQAFGNFTQVFDTVATPSNLATTDIVQVVKIPAGLQVTEVLLDNTDLDSGTTVVHKVGYAPVRSGSTLTADDDYFGASLTHLRAPSRTAMSGFAPVVFNEDVWLTVILTAGPATTAGTITGFVGGITQGVK